MVAQPQFVRKHYGRDTVLPVTPPSSTVVPPTAAAWSTTQTSFIWRRSLSRASSWDCYCRTAFQLLCSACVERTTFSCHLCGQSRLVQGAAEDTPAWHCLTLNIESPCPWFWLYFIETGTLIFRIGLNTRTHVMFYWHAIYISCKTNSTNIQITYTVKHLKNVNQDKTCYVTTVM